MTGALFTPGEAALILFGLFFLFIFLEPEAGSGSNSMSRRGGAGWRGALGRALLNLGDLLAILGQLHGDMRRCGETQRGGLLLKLMQMSAADLKELLDMGAFGGFHRYRSAVFVGAALC